MDNKGTSITMTPAVLLGLLIGVAILIIGLLFLRAIFFKQNVNKNDFDELTSKLLRLNDGEDTFVQYETTGTGKGSLSVVGFDKGQNKVELKFKSKEEKVRDFETGAMITVPGSIINVEYVRPSSCSIHYACLCSCVNKCEEKISCVSFKGIEKIEGSNNFNEFNGWEIIENDRENTFIIPPADNKRLLLHIKREKESIFINS